MGSDSDEIGLSDADSVSGPEENRELYDRWAETYEESFVAAEGYRNHQRVATIYSETGGVGPALDIGCGTGVVGLELQRLGVGPLDGVDISPAMLEEAAHKVGSAGPVYRRLFKADLTSPLAIASDSYHGLVSAGAFAHGHLGPDRQLILVRVTVSGVLGVIGINSAHFSEHGFESYFDALVIDRRIGGFELVSIPIYDEAETSDPDRVSNVVVFEVS